MKEMRKYGTGTYINATATWRLKEKKDKEGNVIRPNLAKSTKQLSELFGVDIPPSETKSRKYWEHFLSTYQEFQEKRQGIKSPLQERIKSLEILVDQFRSEGRDTTELEIDLSQSRKVPAYDCDHVDGPVLHPDMQQAASVLALNGNLDELSIRMLNSLVAPKAINKKESLKEAVQRKIDFHKKKGNHGWYEVQTALKLLLQATGDISVKQIDSFHWREFNRIIDECKLSDRTKLNRAKIAREFLRQVEAEFSEFKLNFAFLRLSEFKRTMPDGEKVKYTLEQVRTALANATGIARTALLLGLNCGFYLGDIIELNTSHVVDGHIKKSRAKLKHKKNAMRTSWLMWADTQKCLAFGLTEYEIVKAYDLLKKEFGLPDHKALRKTVAQWIEDEFDKELSRIYRGEKESGCHDKFYSELTPAGILKLDTALKAIEVKLFG